MLDTILSDEEYTDEQVKQGPCGLHSGVLVCREDKHTCILQLTRRLQGLRKQQREIPICISRSGHAPSNKALLETSEYGPCRQKRVGAKLWADPFSLWNVLDLMTPISSKCLSFLSGTLNYHLLVRMLLTSLSTHLLLAEQSILCKWRTSKLSEWKLLPHKLQIMLKLMLIAAGPQG